MRSIVIIGAGAAGVSLFVHLACEGLKDTESVTLIDPNPPGRGIAFGDSNQALLCNTSAGIQSIISSAPSDFLDYCRSRGLPTKQEDYVPRALVGDYCRDRFQDCVELAVQQGIRVVHVPDRALSITPTIGGHQVSLANGGQLQCSKVAICAGLTKPRIPDGFQNYREHPRLILMPYPTADMRARIAVDEAQVLVVGSGLSAIDIAHLLCIDGYQVTMASRSGVLPAVRSRFLYNSRPFEILSQIRELSVDDPDLHNRLKHIVTAAVREIHPLPLRDQVSHAVDPLQRLREETQLAVAGLCHWQEAAYALLDIIMDWTAGVSQIMRDALLAPYRQTLWRYLGAMALPNAQRLLKHAESGLLRLTTYNPIFVRGTEEGFEVSGKRYDYVVGAAGFSAPALFRSGQQICIDDYAKGAAPVTSVGPDLRVEPNVWLAGMTNMRIPVNNFLPSTVRQAEHVAGRLLS
ncbi:FAD/NAD(P)-binding protein [Streptomyces lavendulocolor]|uniref:FAD/NAD(P)-binding protein n=1 Tax=Streptomyces lavendulocolor TaxID=67316 RepID=UPI0033EBD900